MQRKPERQPLNLYERLDLPLDATHEHITAAYRRLALELHPDSASHRADPNRLQEVIAAYRVLSDPELRREYDARIGRTPMEDAARSSDRCAVCRGTGVLQAPCPHCGGAGYRLVPTQWLQTAATCPRCAGRRTHSVRCGSCAGTGKQ